MKIDVAREMALKIVNEIEEEKGYSNIVLNEYLNKYRERLNTKDISFISELVYGVITWKLTIDTILQKYSKTKLNKISHWILNILRIGVYQIVFLDKIPKAAAVNEAVNLSKKYGYQSTRFVNAILRKIEKQDYEELNQITNGVERLSKVYSMPIWLVEKLLEEYAVQEVETILKNSNLKPMLSIRMNPLKVTKEEFLEQLTRKKVQYEEAKKENFVYLKNVKNIADWDIFKQGLCTVQDEGAGEIVEILAPKKGEIILDACSAPGGKTTYIAEKMQNEGRILAWDIHEHRVNLVKETAQRLGIKIIQTEVRDATKMQKEYIEYFDKILLDVPCLGFGVMKRKPDIKWQRQKEDISEIKKIQVTILKICSQYLKVGGELVYSTCSILKEENEEIMEKFLEESNVEGSRNKEKFSNIFQKTILPQKNSDGFYINKIRRI